MNIANFNLINKRNSNREFLIRAGQTLPRPKPIWTEKNLRKACLITFGCQMNEYDSGRLSQLLSNKGWTLTDDRDEADFIFFNTCSIREKAAQKVLNHLEQMKPYKKRRQLIIAVGGCVAEQEGQALLDLAPWLDLVVGPQYLPHIPDLLERLNTHQERLIVTGSGERPAWSSENLADLNLMVADSPEAEPTLGDDLKYIHDEDDLPACACLVSSEMAAGNKAKILGSVTIMQGCDNYCAYCVVPYVRGPELSRQPQDILEEVKSILDEGVMDLTLLGQNVNSYGRGLPGSPNFPYLLEKVANLGIKRLRFTTSHPKDFPPELVKLFGQMAPLCENLHLPVQSGSDKILKSMGRIYTRDSYLKLVDDLRRVCPDLALTTDIIVGFPGETEADFEDTLDLIKTVGYDAMFSFKYSDRPQTRSASFENKVPEEEKARRLTQLQKMQKDITLAKNSAHVGQILEVLVEHVSERYQGQLTGRARNFKLIHFDGSPDLIGHLVQVKVDEAWAASLRGSLVKAD